MTAAPGCAREDYFTVSLTFGFFALVQFAVGLIAAGLEIHLHGLAGAFGAIASQKLLSRCCAFDLEVVFLLALVLDHERRLAATSGSWAFEFLCPSPSRPLCARRRPVYRSRPPPPRPLPSFS